MFEKPSFEIPAAVREVAEKNVEQTRQAYGQLMAFAHQAQSLMGRAQGDTMRNVTELQTKAMRLAQDNVESNFKFAAELARAQDMNEYAQIQQRYAETQLKGFQQQSEEIGRMLTDLARKVQPPG